MVARRKSAAQHALTGRTPGRDAAGRVFADAVTAYAPMILRARAAGVDVDDWFIEAVTEIRRLADLNIRNPSQRFVDDIAEIEDAMRLGLADIGIASYGLVPNASTLAGIRYSSSVNRGE